jgi:ATP synthase F1 complex assembly factor 1
MNFFCQFVLPLPKNGGYEFYLLQFGGESLYFTQLVKYHMYKENSPVCLTLNFYKDLEDLKDLVLIRGEFDTETLVRMTGKMLYRLFG